jgi:outer membrane protein assembly factor BamB
LDGTLAKYEAQTGQKLWEIQLESALLRMPISQGNDLIAFTSGQTLYSVGFQDGKVNWLTATEYPKNLIVRSLAAPVIYEGNIFLGVNSGEIIVFDANTGAQGKKIDVGISSGRFRDFTGSMLAISGKLYYSRYDGLMGSYDVSSSGKESGEVWQQQITDIATSAVRNGIFYIGCVNGDVYAYRLTDGKRLWRTATGSSVRQLTVGEHQIYLGSATGRIVAMNIKDGDILWHDHLRNAITSPPVYINGDLFFSTGYKNLYGYKLQFSDTNPL